MFLHQIFEASLSRSYNDPLAIRHSPGKFYRPQCGWATSEARFLSRGPEYTTPPGGGRGRGEVEARKISRGREKEAGPAMTRIMGGREAQSPHRGPGIYSFVGGGPSGNSRGRWMARFPPTRVLRARSRGGGSVNTRARVAPAGLIAFGGVRLSLRRSFVIQVRGFYYK